MASATGLKEQLLWKKLTDASFPPRFDHSMVSITPQSLILFGGMAEGWTLQNDSWEFNLKNNTWTPLNAKGAEKDLPVPAKDHSAAVDQANKRMYIFGGKTLQKRSMNQLYIFDLVERKWTSLEPDDSFPCKRYGASLVFRNHKLFLFGGKRHTKDSGGLDDLWEFDTVKQTWKQIQPTSKDKPTGMVYHSAVVHGNEMIVCGGYVDKAPIATMWSLNLDSFAWTQLQQAPFAARSGHAAAVTGHSMFIFGGEGWNSEGCTCLNDLWVYDINSHIWEEKNLTSPPSQRLGVKGAMLEGHFVVSCGIQVSKDWNAEAWFKDLWIVTNSS